MEIASKRLYKHALLLAAVVIGVFIVSAMLVSLTSSSISQGLITQVMHIQPGSNGVAHVSFESKQKPLGDVGHQAGQTTQHVLIIESAAQETN
jgi:hypothetical protein